MKRYCFLSVGIILCSSLVFFSCKEKSINYSEITPKHINSDLYLSVLTRKIDSVNNVYMSTNRQPKNINNRTGSSFWSDIKAAD